MQRMHSTQGKRAAAALCVVWAAACGGAEPPPANPTPHASTEAPRKHRPTMSVSGQLGSLDERKVDATFNRLTPMFGNCLSEASSRIEFIGGHVKFFVRISEDGATKWVYLSESTIGDRNAERCMLNAAKQAKWPAPVDGEGQAQKAFDFDPSPDVRQAVQWDAEHIAKPLAAARPKLAQCRERAPGRYKATLYVQTDGSTLGAGVTPPDERGEGMAVDCMVEVLKELKLPSPGSWPAKVTFDIE